MKHRTGFRKIVVDGIEYQYDISFPVNRPALVVVYSETEKMEIPLDSAPIPTRPDVAPTWRGKHTDKGFGKYEVACLIKAHIVASHQLHQKV